jgi:hypothetical protein
MTRGFHGRSAADVLFASCAAFITLFLFTVLFVPILAPGIAALFGVEPYCIGQANDIPGNDEIVFPGDTISVNLRQQTLEGWYWIDDLKITILQDRIIPIEIGSLKLGDEIKYRTEYPKLKNSGIFKFKIPNYDKWLGMRADVSYSLSFFYPEKISPYHFVWSSKNINGTFPMVIGTASQRNILDLIVALMWVISIVAAAICWFIVFYLAGAKIEIFRRVY